MAELDNTVTAFNSVKIESDLPAKLDNLELDESAAAKVDEKEKPSISFSIWPPSERTRKAIITRLIENLTTQSSISKRYGTLSAEEAESAAKLVEEESFVIAGGDKKVDDDGIEVLQVYSKEISKRMLEVLKARGGGGGSSVDGEKGGLSEKVAKAEEEASVENK